MKKKIISGILSLVMLMSLLPVSAFATETSPVITAKFYADSAKGNAALAKTDCERDTLSVSVTGMDTSKSYWMTLEFPDGSGHTYVNGLQTTSDGTTAVTQEEMASFNTPTGGEGDCYVTLNAWTGSDKASWNGLKEGTYKLYLYELDSLEAVDGEHTVKTLKAEASAVATSDITLNTVKIDCGDKAIDTVIKQDEDKSDEFFYTASGNVASIYVDVKDIEGVTASNATEELKSLVSLQTSAENLQWEYNSSTKTFSVKDSAVTPSEKADATISNAGPVALAGTGAKSDAITVTAGEGATITATSANPKVATVAVANDGKVTITAVAAGSTKVTVNSTETATHKAGSFEITVNVTNLGVTVAGVTGEKPFGDSGQGLAGTDIQSGITPAEPSGTVIKVTGASKYITGWTDFSSVSGQENGHYVLLKFTRVADKDIFIESPTENNLKKAVDWNDGLLLIRLENTNNWKCKFVVGEAKANAANECDTTKPYTEYTLDFTAVVREPAVIARVAQKEAGKKDNVSVSYSNGTASLSGVLLNSDFTEDTEVCEVTMEVTVSTNAAEDVVVSITKDENGKLTATKKDWDKVGGLDLAIDISGLVMKDPNATAEGGVAAPTTKVNEELTGEKLTAASAANDAISGAATGTPPIPAAVLDAVADKIANETKIDTVAVVATDDVKNQLETEDATNLATVKGLVDNIKNAANADAKAAAEEALTNGTKQVVLVSQEIAVVDVEPTVGAAPATLTIDITPVATTVLVGKDVATDDIKVLADDASNKADANAVVIKESEPVTIDTPTDVKLTLPSGYADGKYTIEHKKGNTSYWYEGSVLSDVLTFTSTHGFSEFVIYATSPCEAKIGDTLYKTFTEAVNAVKDGEEIVLLKNLALADMPVSVTSSVSKTFTIDATAANQFGANYIAESENVTVSGTAPNFIVTYAIADEPDTPPTPVNPVNPGNGSSGGSVSGNVTTNPTSNGRVSISPAAPSKGATVTINLTPDTGYEVGSVTVKDADGNTVDVVKVNDTQYTFVMPDGKVSVDATFTQVQQPSDEPFTDVSASDYFYDAVLWAVEKGITTGDGVNTFGPNKSCTRAQMVTFLWRAAGSPAPTGTNSFNDVAAGEYYTDAVLWAVEKGITNGTGIGTFSPNDTVTRGQTVTFLYRYASSPAVSGGESFGDVASTDYFADAVQWAVANGITYGDGVNTFSPAKDCTRGQIVTFMYRQMAE